MPNTGQPMFTSGFDVLHDYFVSLATVAVGLIVKEFHVFARVAEPDRGMCLMANRIA
jgi:hypothetical protein